MGSGQGQRGGKGGGRGLTDPSGQMIGLPQSGRQPPTPYTPPQNQPQQPNLTQFGQQVQSYNQSGGNLSDYGRFIQQYNQPQQPVQQPPTPYTPPQNQPQWDPTSLTAGHRPSSTELPYYQPGMSLPELARAGSEAGVTLGQLGQPGPQRPSMPQQGYQPQPWMQPQIPQWGRPGGSVERMPGWSINTAGKGSPGGRRQPQPGLPRLPRGDPRIDYPGSANTFPRWPEFPTPGGPVPPWGQPPWGQPGSEGELRTPGMPQRRPMPQFDRGRWGQQRGMDRQYQDFRQRKGYLGGQGNQGMAGMFRNSNLQGIWDRPLQDQRSDWRSRRFMG